MRAEALPPRGLKTGERRKSMNVEMRTQVDEKQAALFCDMAENKGVSCSEALMRFVETCVRTGDFPFLAERVAAP